MNLDIMNGLLNRLESAGLEAKLDPVEGQSCVKRQGRDESVEGRVTD